MFCLAFSWFLSDSISQTCLFEIAQNCPWQKKTNKHNIVIIQKTSNGIALQEHSNRPCTLYLKHCSSRFPCSIIMTLESIEMFKRKSGTVAKPKIHNCKRKTCLEASSSTGVPAWIPLFKTSFLSSFYYNRGFYLQILYSNRFNKSFFSSSFYCKRVSYIESFILFGTRFSCRLA